MLNGHPAFFRGTLECCIFPLTGYPPTDVDVVEARHPRLQGAWAEPDSVPFLVSAGGGVHRGGRAGLLSSRSSARSGRNPGEDKALGDWLYAESERIVRAYGNHPSFLLLTHGNEPRGKNRDDVPGRLGELLEAARPAPARHQRLGLPATAREPVPRLLRGVPVRGRIGWLGKDYQQDVKSLTVPVIVHEMGQWCVYPNFDEMRKYTGPLKPKNFEIFRDSLAEHGMLDQWRDFLRASGKLQALCYKEEIEAALRTPGIGGFELLDLHDFPGQGTALVGVLDPFWESKGYVTAGRIPPLLQYDRAAGAAAEARVDDRRDPLGRGRGRALRADATGPRRGRPGSWWPRTGRSLAKGEFPARTGRREEENRESVIPLGQGTSWDGSR